MNAPIQVAEDEFDWYFICRLCGCIGSSHPEMPDWTRPAAADAGCAHLAAHHTAVMPEGYSRRCGVSVASCAANECGCVPVDPDPVKVAQIAAQPFRPCDRPDCPICATRNALQTAHNESRESC